MKKQPKYSPEVIERAVRMVSEAGSQHDSQWAAITSIAAKIGCTPETLCRWVRQRERDTGQRPGPTLSVVLGLVQVPVVTHYRLAKPGLNVTTTVARAA